MVVPYSSYQTINQLIGMTVDAAATVPPAVEAPRSAQQHFVHLLQEAERRHRDTLQRAIQAETQVQQLRQVFQQWQRQLQQQMRQRLADRELQQRQVQRQMQALYDAQQQVRRKVDEMAVFQQLHAFSHQQHLGQVQLQVFSLDRGQRAERRSRQALQRQVSQTRRSTLRQSRAVPAARDACNQDNCNRTVCNQAHCNQDYCNRTVCNQADCNQDDCCPCEFPEDCPFNPCLPSDCFDAEIPEGPTDNCLLRDIRLGLVQPPSCIECEPQGPDARRTRQRTRCDSEAESGYDADDEASSFSTASSASSSAFIKERRQILQEVRSLENIRLAPRYKEIWKPLRCFHCGRPDHLATFCPKLPTTTL